MGLSNNHQSRSHSVTQLQQRDNNVKTHCCFLYYQLKSQMLLFGSSQGQFTKLGWLLQGRGSNFRFHLFPLDE